MSQILDQIIAAKRTLDGMDDNLCEALLLLAANRSIVIIPQDDRLLPKPTIMVPQRIYNRLLGMTKDACQAQGGEQ